MRVHSISLKTQNLDRQLEFYRDRLGLSVLEVSEHSVTFKVGSSKLEFIQGVENTFYHFAFNIPSHQFIEAVDWLKKRVTLIRDASGHETFHSETWNADMVYFYDPGGNIAEFIARHDLKSDQKAPFSAGSLECISELGVVTENVPQTVKHIQNLLGAPLYRAELNEAFVSVGDETGLLIVVRQGRIWFPETKAAIAAPFKVVLFQTDGQTLDLMQESLQRYV